MPPIVDGPHRPLAHALLEAGAVAGVAFAAVVPYLYYLTHVAFPEAVRRGPVPLERVLEADLTLIGLALVICATSGSLLARRYRLPGLGTLGLLRRGLPYLLLGGAVLAAATYLLFGRHLARQVPGLYPAALHWALLLALKGALFDETVARYGVMTILCGAVRRPWLAAVLQAFFFTFLSHRRIGFFGLAPGWSPAYLASLVSSVGVHLAQAAAYARLGLLSAAAMHLVVDLKLVAHALLQR